MAAPLEASAETEIYRLALADSRSIVIAVAAAEGDDITAAIKSGAYRFPPGFSLLAELSAPGGRVLDLGAHIGAFALFAAASGYAVLAVEASARNASLLQQSRTRNGFDSIHIVNQAVSDRAEEIEFIQAGPYGHVAIAPSAGPRVSVQAAAVDDLLAAAGWDQVAFVKMDIEGSEVKAVQGMARLLARDPAPAVFFESNGHTLHLFGQTPNTLLAQFEHFGYTCYLVERGQLTPVRAADLQPECTVDYLAVKSPLPRLRQWRLGKPMSMQAVCAKLLATCTHPHEHNRAYIGRALAQADPTLLADRNVQRALHALKRDAAASVREAVAWWSQPVSLETTSPAPWKSRLRAALHTLRDTLTRR